MNYTKIEEEFLIQLISTNPKIIEHIPDSTEAMQLAALKQDFTLYRHIPNPTILVQKVAIRGALQGFDEDLIKPISFQGIVDKISKDQIVSVKHFLMKNLAKT